MNGTRDAVAVGAVAAGLVLVGFLLALTSGAAAGAVTYLLLMGFPS